ncbi:MAG TPA: hypothetical protein VFH87_01765 [Candidatus Udaeobacter sp.]|nr:hypothetical protein [Candidatus Udaeobacter sp.]
MKTSNVFFYNKLEEIHKTLVAHDVRVNERLEKIDAQLKLILSDEPKHVSKELEKAIKEVSLRAHRIDEKVSDS